MTEKAFQYLMDKYLTGHTTLAEEKLIDHFFNIQYSVQKPGKENEVSIKMWSEIRRTIDNGRDGHQTKVD